MKVAWKRLVNEGKVVFGKNAPANKNLELLCKKMVATDKSLKPHLKEPPQSQTKKYDQLYNFVRYRTNLGQNDESLTDSLQSDTSKMDIKEDAQIFSDNPEIGQGSLHKTLATSNDCQSTQIILDSQPPVTIPDQQEQELDEHDTTVKDI